MYALKSWTRALALVTLHSSLTHAIVEAPLIAQGSAPSQGYATIIAASDSPNATHSVPFQHYDTYTSESESFITQEWMWSVGVSDVAMANASRLNDSGVPQIPDAHVAYTTYTFSWPESGDLDQALQTEVNATGESSQSCALIVSAYLPTNLAKNWNASSSNCSSALGSDCVKYLTANWTTSDDCTHHIPYGLSDPGLLDACPTSFGYLSSSQQQWGIGSYAFGNVTGNGTSINKGDVYAYSVSDPYAAGNTSAYARDADNFHILVLTSQPTGSNLGQGQQAQVLCNRAGNGSSAGADGTGAARALDAGIAMVCSVALITMVVNVL